MSRGHGKIQRRILDHLRTLKRNEYGVWADIPLDTLTEYVFRSYPASDAQLVSVRRAVRALAREGIVHTYRRRSPHLEPGIDGDGVERLHPERYWQRRGRQGRSWPVTVTRLWVTLAPDPTPEEREAADRSMAEFRTSFGARLRG